MQSMVHIWHPCHVMRIFTSNINSSSHYMGISQNPYTLGPYSTVQIIIWAAFKFPSFEEHLESQLLIIRGYFNHLCAPLGLWGIVVCCFGHLGFPGSKLSQLPLVGFHFITGTPQKGFLRFGNLHIDDIGVVWDPHGRATSL